MYPQLSPEQLQELMEAMQYQSDMSSILTRMGIESTMLDQYLRMQDLQQGTLHRSRALNDLAQAQAQADLNGWKKVFG